MTATAVGRHRGAARVEWQTIAVAVAVYGGLALATWHHAAIPIWLLPLVGGYLVCWHGSLQHEVVHGHPTTSHRVNRAVAWLPVCVWMPFELYRRSHIEHHRTPELTGPGLDPESFYVTGAEWGSASPWHRAVLTANTTLLGRLTIGPLLVVTALLRAELPRLRERDRAGIWLRHVAGVTLVLTWVAVVCHMPIWLYFLTFAWPGLSLTLLRSYHEHQPTTDAEGRTNSIYGPLPIRLLYLNNNFHAAHHAAPDLPWYDLPARHGERGWDGSYAGLAAHPFRRKDAPAHPFV